ncbi:hypothetical protein [Flavobacterium sp. CFS9]
MKKILIILFIFFYNLVSSQIVYGEETYYSLTNGEKKHSKYHFIKSEYSLRSYQIFITNSKNFEKIKSKIPRIFSKKTKQDYTDIYLLGISNFDEKQISENDKKIIDDYIDEINRYRVFYNLSIIKDRNFLVKNIIRYINNENDLCLYLLCPAKNKKVIE